MIIDDDCDVTFSDFFFSSCTNHDIEVGLSTLTFCR